MHWLVKIGQLRVGILLHVALDCWDVVFLTFLRLVVESRFGMIASSSSAWGSSIFFAPWCSRHHHLGSACYGYNEIGIRCPRVLLLVLSNFFVTTLFLRSIFKFMSRCWCVVKLVTLMTVWVTQTSKSNSGIHWNDWVCELHEEWIAFVRVDTLLFVMSPVPQFFDGYSTARTRERVLCMVYWC